MRVSWKVVCCVFIFQPNSDVQDQIQHLVPKTTVRLMTAEGWFKVESVSTELCVCVVCLWEKYTTLQHVEFKNKKNLFGSLTLIFSFKTTAQWGITIYVYNLNICVVVRRNVKIVTTWLTGVPACKRHVATVTLDIVLGHIGLTSWSFSITALATSTLFFYKKSPMDSMKSARTVKYSA